MQRNPIYASSTTIPSVSVNKVLKNTYLLLAMTLVFSAVTAGVSMAMNLGFGVALICNIAGIGLLWFGLPRVANSSKGIGMVFAITGLLGLGLGPMLNHYAGMANGSALIMQALAGTAIVFFTLSGYVLTTRKDFSYMQGFIMAGLVVVLLAILGNFFFQMPALSLAISAAIILIMSAAILWETSNIINGGETNYIMATVSLYISILNIFTSLLHLLGIFSDE